jgi:hypothetical protein
VIYNLDSNQRDVYGESNLIEARAAAILTPYLMRHAPAVFFESFPVSSHKVMIRSGQNGCVLDKLVMDKLVTDKLREHAFSCEENVGKTNPYSCHSERSEESGFLPAAKRTQIPRYALDDNNWTECLIDETYS